MIVETNKKKKKLAGASVTYTTGDPVLNTNFFNKDTAGSIGNTGTAGGTEAGCAESLTEDTMYAHRLHVTVDLPPHIHTVNSAAIRDVILKVEPEEEFEVGYVTPVYFYKKLWDKFTLIKCTEMHGWTGEDYIEARADKTNSEQRIELAKQQTAKADIWSAIWKNSTHAGSDGGSHADGLPGYNSKVDYSAQYTLVNKLVARDNAETLLFYPIVGSHPRVTYYIDLKDGNGYQVVSRADLEDTIYAAVKKLLLTDKYAQQCADKVRSMLNIDSKTIEAVAFDAEDKYDTRSIFDILPNVSKPQVRALYTSQIYYLKTKDTTLGKKDPIHESLETSKTTNLWDWLEVEYKD